MSGNSRAVTSNQKGVHERLEEVVLRHRSSSYLKPVREHNLKAFERLQAFLDKGWQGLILDSCCGTGQSTLRLAAEFPGHAVVGIDQSEARLGREGLTPPSNLCLLRGNCEDLWRLCLQHGIRADRHYLLYPNPYPKSVHLKRRWHGHPVFPLLPQLAPVTELRSNWRLYLEEFAWAWKWLGHSFPAIGEWRPQTPWTRFESKYLASGQALFRVQAYSSDFES